MKEKTVILGNRWLLGLLGVEVLYLMVAIWFGHPLGWLEGVVLGLVIVWCLSQTTIFRIKEDRLQILDQFRWKEFDLKKLLVRQEASVELGFLVRTPLLLRGYDHKTREWSSMRLLIRGLGNRTRFETFLRRKLLPEIRRHPF